MVLPGLKSAASLFVAALFALPVFGSVPNAMTAMPGSLNYVEGRVSTGTQPLDPSSIGAVGLQAGESLATENGKAEVLLTPGVFLRVGDNSSVKMISPGLATTVVEVDKGHAMVEVEDIYKANDIRILEGGATVRLLKTGLYDFDLSQNKVRVFDGRASVEVGGKSVTLKGGRELNLAEAASPKAAKFDRDQYAADELYRWSSLRSAYLAEANVDLGAQYGANVWGGWAGNGWYWDPWFDAYTFVPGDGIFFSAFGWGFYSPWLAIYAPCFPFYGYGFGHGFGGGPFPHHFSADAHSWGVRSPYLAGANYSHGVYHGEGSSGGGFHSGPQMVGVRSAGEAGGATGFSGGGMNGGFHGGGGFSGGGFGGGGFGGGHR